MQNTENTIVVQEDGKGERLDKYLVSQLPHRSRSAIAGFIKDGKVTLNGRVVTPHIALKVGDEVVVPAELAGEAPDMEAPLTPRPDIALNIIFEDEQILVLDKPAGTLMHPAVPGDDATLAQAVLAHVPAIATVGESVARPGIMQRLDKEASGVVVFAKTAAAHADLKAQFQEHDVTKEYLVLVLGAPPHDEGTVRLSIGRKSGQGRMSARPALVEGDRPAVTHYEVMERFDNTTLLRVRTETGRTHQIRVHMKALGCPVAGDELYGPTGGKKVSPRLFLHAAKLGFKHPTTGELVSFESPLPAELETVLAKLRK